MNIPIKLLSSNAKVPTRAKDGDAAYDLYAAHSEEIRPGERKLIKTNIAIAIPKGYYGRIAERSGLALKQALKVGGGVVDSSYRGDVGVIAINLSQGDIDETILVTKGDRIAQLIIEKYYDAEFQVVEDLDKTDRGGTGFGSSGVAGLSKYYTELGTSNVEHIYIDHKDPRGKIFNPLDHEQTK